MRQNSGEATVEPTNSSGASTNKHVRVAAFTGGKNISGARFRVRQYIPILRLHGIEMDEFFSRWQSWPPKSKIQRPFWLMGTIADRVPSVLGSRKYQATFFQRELVSTLTTLEPFTKRPRVFDVDDAVWLNRGGRTGFGRILRMCDGVVCGNQFIAENARQWNQNICLIPTPVDTERYVPAPMLRAGTAKRIIGWSGLAVGLKYLYEIEEALVKVLNKHKDVVLRVISETAPEFRHLSSCHLEYVPWSPSNEVKTIQEMYIGLMPVEDTLWAKGKCSYKMLLYMSCGVPVVVSPVGMNAEVLGLGRIGFGPRKPDEWIEALEWLLDNPEEATRMGQVGRQIIEQHYSLSVHGPRLASFMRSIAG